MRRDIDIPGSSLGIYKPEESTRRRGTDVRYVRKRVVLAVRIPPSERHAYSCERYDEEGTKREAGERGKRRVRRANVRRTEREREADKKIKGKKEEGRGGIERGERGEGTQGITTRWWIGEGNGPGR